MAIEARLYLQRVYTAGTRYACCRARCRALSVRHASSRSRNGAPATIRPETLITALALAGHFPFCPAHAPPPSRAPCPSGEEVFARTVSQLVVCGAFERLPFLPPPRRRATSPHLMVVTIRRVCACSASCRSSGLRARRSHRRATLHAVLARRYMRVPRLSARHVQENYSRR